MARWQQYAFFAVWLDPARIDAAVGEQLHCPPCDHDCDVHGLDAVVEFHRRLCGLSVVLDRGFLWARLLCRSPVAAGRRADGARLGHCDAVRRRIRRALGRHHPAASGPLLRDRLDRCRRSGAAARIVVGQRHRRRRRPQLAAVERRPECRRPDLPAGDDPDHACGLPDDGLGRPQPARLWPAVHSAERGRRQHGRRQHHALQDHRLYAVGAVLRDRRRILRLVDGLYRPDRVLLHPHVHQDTGDVSARRARHRSGRGHRHRRVHAP